MSVTLDEEMFNMCKLSMLYIEDMSDIPVCDMFSVRNLFINGNDVISLTNVYVISKLYRFGTLRSGEMSVTCVVERLSVCNCGGWPSTDMSLILVSEIFNLHKLGEFSRGEMSVTHVLLMFRS